MMEKLKLKFNSRLFSIGILSFLAIQVFGLWCGWRILLLQNISGQMAIAKIPWYGFFVYFLFATVLMFVFLKFFHRRKFFKFAFGFMIWWGAFKIGALFMPWLGAIIFSVLAVFIYFYYFKIYLHNVLLVLPIVMAGCVLSFYFSVNELALILLFLSIYDYLAVTQAKTMVKMFKGLAERQIILALIIADSWSSLVKKISDIRIMSPTGEREFSFIGTGDLAFPIIFSVSVLARYGLSAAIGVVVGAVLGFAFCDYLLLKFEKPLPGLPFISLGCVLGFVLIRLIM